MSHSGGIGGPSPAPIGKGEISEGVGGQQGAGVMKAPISNLQELKGVLVSAFGEQEGTKAYNNFIKSFAMMMLNQVQHSADQAKKAAQKMRMDTR